MTQAQERLGDIASLVASGEFSDEHAATLRALLDQEDPILAIERALTLAEDPRVLELARTHALPDPLVEELVGVFAAHMFSLGARATGGLRALTAQARRLLDAARRVDGLVRKRLDGLEHDAAVALLARYIHTSPATAFIARLEREHPELIASARSLNHTRTDPDACFAPDADLAALLRAPQTDTRTISSRLAATLVRLDDPRAACEVAARGPNEDYALIASSVLAFLRIKDACDLVLAKVLASSADAPALAAAAASLDPEKTRQALSLMLADSAWGNPEEPEHEMTLARARALVTARAILPSVGSPAPPIVIEELGARLRAHKIEDVPDAVDAHTARWRALIPD